MQYLGGKSRISLKIANLIYGVFPNARIGEPFAGGLGATKNLRSVEISDAHPGLLVLYKAVLAGWEPSYEITKEKYNLLRQASDWGDPHTALAAFGCSFGGKQWGGFAAPNKNNPEGYAGYAIRSLRKALLHKPVVVDSSSYEVFAEKTTADVLYCDPPYANTTGYGSAFDTEKFWSFVSACDKPVFVSEYYCPIPHDGVLEIPHRQNVNRNNYTPTVERVFCFVSGRLRPGKPPE